MNDFFCIVSDEGKWEVILESSDGVIINEELVASKLATSAIINSFSEGKKYNFLIFVIKFPEEPDFPQ